MKRSLGALLIVSALAGAGTLGLVAGRSNYKLPGWLDRTLPAPAMRGANMPEPVGPIVYFRSPDDLPEYSSTPKKTASGKDYLAVRASEVVRFEEIVPETTAAKGGERRIKFYRNPMGLPDTSPTPKKDSMGWTTFPFTTVSKTMIPRSKSAPASCRRQASRPNSRSAER